MSIQHVSKPPSPPSSIYFNVPKFNISVCYIYTMFIEINTTFIKINITFIKININ